MSRRPLNFDDRALAAVLGSKAPATLDRAGRVRLLAEAARALLAGDLPSPEARMFLAGGLASWLRGGGRLTRDYWKVDGPRGSHRTPAALHRDEGHAENDAV